MPNLSAVSRYLFASLLCTLPTAAQIVTDSRGSVLCDTTSIPARATIDGTIIYSNWNDWGTRAPITLPLYLDQSLSPEEKAIVQAALVLWHKTVEVETYLTDQPGRGISVYKVPIGAAGVLAQTYLPPPLYSSPLAGRVEINSYTDWSAHDLYTVVVHELGHALGLGHQQIDDHSVMWPYAIETHHRLSYSDTAAIRYLYSARYPVRRSLP